MKTKPATIEDVIFNPTKAVEALQNDTEIAIDLETGGLSPWNDPIAVISMYGVQSNATALLHIRGYIPDVVRDFLNKPGKLYIGHNSAGFDSLFLAVNGIDIWNNSWYDTMIGEQCAITSGRRDIRVNLQDTLARRTGVKILKGHGESSWMAEQLTEEQIKYCIEDIFYLPRIMQSQHEKVAGSPQERAITFEQGLSPIIAKMILNGLPLDMKAFIEWRNGQELQLMKAYKTIDAILGMGVNIGSSQQVKFAFKDQLDVELESTDAETLASLSEVVGPIGEVAQALSMARHARKRTGMYDDEWLEKYCLNGRVHARYWQVSTDTGRFSSSNPNLQQVPKDGRCVFGGVEGCTMVSVDYSQLEVRIAAALAKDSEMLEALGKSDIHKTVASNIFQIPFEEVSDHQRNVAKAATFTLLFGGSANGLVRYAKVNGSHLSVIDAQNIVKIFSDISRHRSSTSTCNSYGKFGITSSY